MTIGPEERNVVKQQLARFGSQCRLFAPMYRQVTLAGLRTRLAGGELALDRGRGYDDVRDAWRHYLQHDNGGRGVVLIGHSQGAMVLTALIASEIDGAPVRRQLVSAILLGTSLAVPKGKDVGGAFKQVPLCRADGQAGCVVTYASFRATVPPPAEHAVRPGQGRGHGGRLHQPGGAGRRQRGIAAVLTGVGSLIAQAAAQGHRWTTKAAVDTPFVTRARLAHGQVRVERVRQLPRDRRPSRSRGRSRRRHPWRSRPARQARRRCGACTWST